MYLLQKRENWHRMRAKISCAHLLTTCSTHSTCRPLGFRGTAERGSLNIEKFERCQASRCKQIVKNRMDSFGGRFAISGTMGSQRETSLQAHLSSIPMTNHLFAYASTRIQLTSLISPPTTPAAVLDVSAPHLCDSLILRSQLSRSNARVASIHRSTCSPGKCFGWCRHLLYSHADDRPFRGGATKNKGVRCRFDEEAAVSVPLNTTGRTNTSNCPH